MVPFSSLLRHLLLEGVVVPYVLSDMSIRKVTVSLVEQVVNLFGAASIKLEKPKHLLNLLQVLNQVIQDLSPKLFVQNSAYFNCIFYPRIKCIVQSFVAFNVPRIFIPRVANRVKTFKVNRTATHGATCTGTLEVPVLYTVCTKCMRAAQRAKRTNVAVAD